MLAALGASDSRMARKLSMSEAPKAARIQHFQRRSVVYPSAVASSRQPLPEQMLRYWLQLAPIPTSLLPFGQKFVPLPEFVAGFACSKEACGLFGAFPGTGQVVRYAGGGICGRREKGWAEP